MAAIRQHIKSLFENAIREPFDGTIIECYYDSTDNIYVLKVECTNNEIHIGMAVDYMGLIKVKPPNSKHIKYCFKQEDGIPIAFCC